MSQDRIILFTGFFFFFLKHTGICKCKPVKSCTQFQISKVVACRAFFSFEKKNKIAACSVKLLTTRHVLALILQGLNNFLILQEKSVSFKRKEGEGRKQLCLRAVCEYITELDGVPR